MKAVLSLASGVARRHWQHIVVFALVFSLELYNLTTYAFWGDEAATITASTRSIGSLFRLVANVDFVHAAFYLAMHFWLKLFGTSELSLRLPEVLAASAAATLLFVVAKKRTNTISAIVATLGFALMPRVVWAAGIGRSYALTILLSMMLTWILLRIVEDKAASRGWFVAYFVVASIAAILFIYVLFFIAAQAVSVLVLRVGRQKLFRFATAALCAVAVSAPVAIVASRQIYQIGWLKLVDPNYFSSIFGSVLFYSNLQLTILIWGIIAIGLALLFGRRIRRGRTPTTVALARTAAPSLIVALLPSSLIFFYSLTNKALFDGRYFSFSAGAVGLLLAIAVYQIGFNWLRLVALVLVVVLSVGPAFSWRAPYRFGSDYDKLAELIQGEAKTSDAVFFAPLSKHCTGVCTASAGYASYFKHVHIIGLKNETIRVGSLHDRFRSPEATVRQAKHYKRIWYLSSLPGNAKVAAPYLEAFRAMGFKLGPTRYFKFETVTLLSRQG